jgi:hypothetical protein
MKKITLLTIGLSLILMMLNFMTLRADEGIKMNYAETILQNLSIGASYNMTGVANLPLKLTNNEDNDQVFELSVIKPSKTGKIKPGYQPIPDPAWVTLREHEVNVKAKSTHSTDVVITIPDDKKLLGKKYQVDIQAKQKPVGHGVSLSLALRGRLLFSIAPVKLQPAAVERDKVDLNFSITPPRVEVDNIALGKKNNVQDKTQRWLKLKNTGSKATTYYLESLDPKETAISLDPGYESCPNPSFLTFAREKMELKKGEEKPLEMVIQIPDRPEFHGKHYEFLGSVNSGEIKSGRRYFRILVSTEK